MLDFVSPKGRLLILRIMRAGGLALIFYNALTHFHENFSSITVIAVLIVITGFNDLIRERFFRKSRDVWYYFSYILSNALSAYFSYRGICYGTQIYNIVLIVDLLLFVDKIPAFLLVVNFISYSIPLKINTDPTVNLNLQEIFFNYLGTFIVVFIMRSIFLEKVKANKLNQELTNANLKLKEYSKKIEEFTVSRERTRIAQELHDSIGHSLIALNMNLEYAENVVDLKPEKAKEVIIKAHNISKDCIIKLREVVSVLKEDSSVDNLHEAVNKLFENFHNNERYKFNFKMDEDIEKETPAIKSCIYKTIMEGITNGIKHGNADIFDIEITKVHENILFKMSNNGLGCSNIEKSNGTKGIEKRITDLGGTVAFYSENEIGFTIDATMPVGGMK